MRISLSNEEISAHDLGCSNSTPSSTATLVTNTPPPTKVETSTSTVTLIPSDANEATPTYVVTENLNYCNASKLSNCTYSIKLAGNGTVSVYFNLSIASNGKYYCSSEGKRYTLEAIAGYEGKYTCLGFPPEVINNIIPIQIYSIQFYTSII